MTLASRAIAGALRSAACALAAAGTGPRLGQPDQDGGLRHRRLGAGRPLRHDGIGARAGLEFTASHRADVVRKMEITLE